MADTRALNQHGDESRMTCFSFHVAWGPGGHGARKGASKGGHLGLCVGIGHIAVPASRRRVSTSAHMGGGGRPVAPGLQQRLGGRGRSQGCASGQHTLSSTNSVHQRFCSDSRNPCGGQGGGGVSSETVFSEKCSK